MTNKNALGRNVFRAAAACIALGACSTGLAVDFQTRCQEAHVVRCVNFDTPTTIAGTYGDNHGTLPGNAVPQLDTTIKASGAASLKFTVPSNSDANSSGSFFTNFSDNLSVQFGENAEFYVQWRQRFSPEFLNVAFAGGGGWKQAIIGTGDQPGTPYSSCTDLEVVTQNTYHRGFAQMYNSCSGSTSHAPYDPFSTRLGAFDFKLQNMRPLPYCLYSQGQTNPVTYMPPTGNCLGYFANEWMTFQVGIKTGPRVNDEWTNSQVRLWIARAGQPSELVMDHGPYNLTAGAPGLNQRFGKVWLLPYNTNKSSGTAYPVAYIWYDELIVSTTRIADPDASGDLLVAPLPPSNVAAH